MSEIHIFTREDKLSSNCYVMKSDDEYCVIDPSVSLENIKSSLGLIDNPKYVLLTHCHIDHIWELNSYFNARCKILVSENDGLGLSDSITNVSLLLTGKNVVFNNKYTTIAQGDTIGVGKEQIRVIETPGHTKGSLCFVGTDFIFTGDTIFSNGGYGRVDFPGGDANQMAESLKTLLSMDETFTIYSGHGNSTTIKESRKFFV